jgi:hypothetical protein
MREFTVKCRRQKAEGKIGLLLILFMLVVVGGCSVRVTPAASNTAKEADEASKKNALVAANNEPKRHPDKGAEASDTAESSAVPAPINSAAAGSSRSIEQLASTATSVKPAAHSIAQDKVRASNGRTRDVTFDTIKFEMKKEEQFLRSMITPDIEKIFGKRIRIRGYILPAFQNSDLTGFILVRDNLECCFGPGAALYDCIVVEMSPGNTASFTTRPIAVEGVLSLSEVKDPDNEERHLAIYHMVADKAK